MNPFRSLTAVTVNRRARFSIHTQDWNKTIIVVDTPYSALFAACLIITARIYNANILLEKKVNNDHSDYHFDCLKAILEPHKVLILDEITVPANTFIINKKMSYLEKYKALISYRISCTSAFVQQSDIDYIGSTTSSIMACVRKNRSFYFDHGTGDYITLELTQSKLNSPKRIIINQLYILLGLPGFGFKRRVMSPYYLSKYQEFIDLESYLPGPSLNLAFKSLFDAVNSYMNKTLVLPRSPEHVAYEMPTYDPEYDVANLELITKNCQKDELLIIKYHRSLYSKGDFHETLVPRCRALGFTAINLDQYITNILKGNVPAELAVKMLGVNKILSSGSSTTFNLSHNPDLIFVTDVEPYEKMPHEENANAHYADAFMLDKIRRGSLYLSS